MTAFYSRIFTYCLLGVCDLERDRVLDLDRLALLLFLLLLLSFLTLKKKKNHYFRYMFSMLEIKHKEDSLDWFSKSSILTHCKGFWKPVVCPQVLS